MAAAEEKERVMRIGKGVQALMLLLGGCGLLPRCTPELLDDAQMTELYREPLAPPSQSLEVYHLGHSLVGRDMPSMVEQLAPEGHKHRSQLGWGATLKAHWGDEAVAGFDTENAHAHYRPAAEALESGDYDAVVLTEMVEIRDAIRYFDSSDYFRRWALKAQEGNPLVRVYLYETWHPLDDPEGWIERLDRDLKQFWEGEILAAALAKDDVKPIHVIPAGQVFARFVRVLEQSRGIDGLTGREDLFSDQIHLNDLGTYLVALTHYAVLYGRSPVGLPAQLRRADGTPADAPGPRAARMMQEIVWEVVTRYPKTGVSAIRPDSDTASSTGPRP